MPKLYLVGDSTVCSYDAEKDDKNLLYPRNGYGMWLQRRFEGVEVVNLALSGRSSKSFTSEENYLKLKKVLAEGDYLLIAFGHNDEKFGDPSRFTFASGSIFEKGSFKFYLYEYYVKLCKERGAHAILATPIVRRSASGVYEGDRVHRLGAVVCEGIEYPAADYSEAVRTLAEESGSTLVDMTALTKYYYEAVGAETAARLHATASMKESDVDDTHLNSFGAHVIADFFIDGLLDTRSPLRAYVVPETSHPDEETDLIVNKN